MSKKEVTYSELQEQLQSILDELQEGHLDVDEAIVRYKQAQTIINQLEKQLAKAENVIKKIGSQQG